MNARIRELRVEALEWVRNDLETVEREHPVMFADHLEMVNEKFAELIVKECADFADEHNDYSEGVTLGVGRALKKHFGVEE